MANPSNGETLGQIVKKKRLKLGLSLRDLSAKADVSHVSILRIENDGTSGTVPLAP